MPRKAKAGQGPGAGKGGKKSGFQRGNLRDPAPVGMPAFAGKPALKNHRKIYRYKKPQFRVFFFRTPAQHLRYCQQKFFGKISGKK